jgi:Zn-dependent peptidase ImmA (M78 family)
MDTLPVEQAISDARTITDGCSVNDLPINIRSIAKRLGVAEISAAMIGSDGYIGVDRTGRVVIRYNDGSPRQRQRFTIAHEIGHLLISRHVPGGLQHRNRDSAAKDDGEEIAANRLAAELLMPATVFEEQVKLLVLRGVRSPWKIIHELRRLFDVAESSATLRILELPAVAAVLFRIDVAGKSGFYPLDVSPHVPLSFGKSVANMCGDFARDYRRGRTFHEVSASVGGKQVTLNCQGEMRRFKADAGEITQYWVVGWTFL